ncbi:hypothetical protein JCM1841_002208 [Sporobolomyces salmonicolor]
MALIAKRRKGSRKTNKAPQPLAPGMKTKEQSCATCRHRKVRCTGGRPACSHCIKSAAARGIPASSVKCLYSAASMFAKEEDIQLEAKLGGRGARCLWGDDGDPARQGSSRGDEQAISETKEEEEQCEVLDEHETVSSPSSPSTRNSLTPFPAAPSTIPSSPTTCGSPNLSPETQPSVFAPRTTPLPSSYDLVPLVDWDAEPLLFSLDHSPSLPDLSNLPPVRPAPTTPCLLDSPATRSHLSSLRAQQSALPTFPSSTFPSPSDIDSFWDGGPLSRDELRHWAGLRAAARSAAGWTD